MTRHTQLLRPIAIFLLAFGSGCAGFYRTTGDLVDVPHDRGLSETFPYRYESVIEAVRSALSAANLKIEKDQALNDNTWVIYAEAGPFMLRQGEVARILIHKNGERQSTVLIHTEKKMPTNAFEKTTLEYAQQIFQDVNTQLHARTPRMQPHESPPPQLTSQQEQQLKEANRLSELSVGLSKAGKHDQAISQAEAALSLAERSLPVVDMTLERFIFNLGIIRLRAFGSSDFRSTSDPFVFSDETKILFQRAYAIRVQQLGPNHPDTLKLRNFVRKMFGVGSVP